MKPCLILGAGASKPYGYPLGVELKQRIIQYCISNPQECAPPEKLVETWRNGEFSGHSAWKAGREIFKFVHDQADPETVAICRSSVRASDVIVILGFGFDHLNMTRLGLHEGNESQLIISSGYKLDSSTKQRVRATCISKRIHFGREDATALEFLKETRILEPENYEQTNDEVWTRLGSGA